MLEQVLKQYYLTKIFGNRTIHIVKNITSKNEKRIELLFMLYSLGRKIKSFSKHGNIDYALQTLILDNLVGKPRNVKELSKIIHANMSSVSETIEKLVSQGLVVKTCVNDKRCKYNSLTNKGLDSLKNTKSMMALHCVKGFEKLSDSDINEMLLLLKKIEF